MSRIDARRARAHPRGAELMPKTTNIADFQQLAASVTACGGVIPDRIGRLLSAHQLLTAPAS